MLTVIAVEWGEHLYASTADAQGWPKCSESMDDLARIQWTICPGIGDGALSTTTAHENGGAAGNRMLRRRDDTRSETEWCREPDPEFDPGTFQVPPSVPRSPYGDWEHAE
jgi:hypothetical protein